MLDIAQEQVIDRAKHPRFSGSLENATHMADGINQSCGDEVHLELLVQDGVLTSVRHSCRSCTVCAASADLLAERLEGEPVTALSALTPADIQEMIGLALSPIRLKCALLPWETGLLSLTNGTATEL